MVTSRQHCNDRFIPFVRRNLVGGFVQSRLVCFYFSLAVRRYFIVSLCYRASRGKPRHHPGRTVRNACVDAFGDRCRGADDFGGDAHGRRQTGDCPRHDVFRRDDFTRRYDGRFTSAGRSAASRANIQFARRKRFSGVDYSARGSRSGAAELYDDDRRTDAFAVPKRFHQLDVHRIYGIFLAVQTKRHRDFFVAPKSDEAAEDDVHLYEEHEVKSTAYHAIFLVLYILPLVILAKQLAVPLDYGTRALHAPPVLSGFLVAILILAPEAISAVRAAVRNQLQRSVNILLGSVLATIGLTIPAVLTISLITGKTVYLGLGAVDTILLLLLLTLSTITFSNSRTNALIGAVHLLLFLAYLMLMFEN